ncbi:hypothetical protein G6F63_009397 [Rhizopus arrhizus]|nr:hypothetical protein G6F63_009397 [Rhizopus arrhizus]
MSNYQTRISELLEHCQNEWVKLESISATSQTSRELKEVIKQLVQLLDNLDESQIQQAEMLMADARKKLSASKVITIVKPTTSQSSPLISVKPLSLSPKKITKNEMIIEEEEEEEEEKDKKEIKGNTEQNMSRPFGRRSVIVEANNTIETNSSSSNNNKKSLFPLLKGLRPSQSMPVKKRSEEVAHINFYKNDENFVFATDATVDHPLRIGVGYGSYICYSCTIFSDKGTPITVRKRYSDFVELREELIKNYNYLRKSIPKLPPKKVVGKFTPAFVEQRRRELEYFFKYITNLSKKSINSNTSTSLFSKSFTTANSNKADPSQIIITKAIPPQSLKNRLGSQKETAISRGKISNVLSSRLGPRHNITTTPTVITATKSTRTAATFDRPVAEKGSSLSIRGRSHATSSPSGLSIKGESGPTTVLIAGLDRGTNSEDVRLVCEDFGNVLKCEVLRNRMGDSFGEAEVEFSSKSAALDCIAKLDNVKADGQYLRVILRENKLPRSYSATQISSIISTPSTTSSGKMYSDQPSRYGTTRR